MTGPLGRSSRLLTVRITSTILNSSFARLGTAAAQLDYVGAAFGIFAVIPRPWEAGFCD